MVLSGPATDAHFDRESGDGSGGTWTLQSCRLNDRNDVELHATSVSKSPTDVGPVLMAHAYGSESGRADWARDISILPEAGPETGMLGDDSCDRSLV